MEMNTMTMVLWAVLSAVVLVVAYGFHPVYRWRYRHIPGPPPLWYAGNLPEIVQQSAFGYYNSISAAGKYGKVFKVWFGATPTVVVADADLGRAVNLRNPNRHALGGPASIIPAKERAFDEAGILMTKDRAYHRSIRNVWQPAFFTQSLEGFSAHMNEGAERLIRRLAKVAAREQEIDIWRYLGSMTMDVVGVSSFGVEFRTQDDEADASTSQEAQELIAAAQTIFKLTGATASLYVPAVLLCPPLLPIVRFLAGIWPDAGMRTAVAARATLVRTCANLLRKVREADGAQLPNGVPSAGPPKRGVLPGSFLHHLARARHHPTFREGALLTDAEVISQAFSFLLGGYETTASSLGFTIYNLSANPDKAAKLTEELDAFGRDRVPVNGDLEHLLYTQACFKEALRLFPPGHITIREAVEDLNLAGHHIPKGTWIHVAVCAIHRDPQIWGKNADEYVPERWVPGAPEEATDAQKKAWMPFGDGARACVGKRFAWEEALIALIRIYQRFEFKLSPGQVPLAVQSPFVLGPSRGIMVVPMLRKEE